MVMQSVVIITISCKNTENWEDRICCQLVLMGKLDLFYHVSRPLMTKVATESDFIQCDITYDECKQYPYISNAVAFNSTVMGGSESMVR